MEFTKDPNAVLDYGFDWSEWLATGETIATSVWVVTTGITKDSDLRTATETKVWLSGGIVNGVYRARNRITTSQSRTDDRTIIVRVVER
jgi:hypothetical protein